MEKKNYNIASLGVPGFYVYLDQITRRDQSNGQRIRLEHPGAAAVVAVTSDKKVVMVEQYRYAMGKNIVEIPAGKLDPGESPEQCAKREMLEETGYELGSIEYVCPYAPAVGYSDEIIHIFYCNDAKKVNDKIDEREISSVTLLDKSQIKAMIAKGEIVDGKTLLGLSLRYFSTPVF